MERPQFDLEKLAAFCRQHRIRKLSLFGSVLHGTNTPESDLDLLVEFEPESTIGLFGMAQLQIDLEEMFDRQVDLRTPMELSRYFREAVVGEAEVIYAAA